MVAAKVALMVFLSVMLAVKALSSRTEGKSEDIVKRVRMYSRQNDTDAAGASAQKNKSILRIFSSFFRAFTPKKVLDRVERDLIQADVMLKPEEMVTINIITAVFPAIIAVVVLQNIVLAVLLLPLGAYAPLIFLKNAKINRSKKFNNQLGDALTIMSNSLRAGFSFLQTMDSLSKEMAPPISTEFSRALQEMRLGTHTEEALQNMASRIISEDLELIITAVNIQRQVGGNLAQILDNISVTINERVRMKAEIKTMTAQGRISGTIVALLPVFIAVVISFINPTYIGTLFTHPIGLVLLGSAIFSEIIGIMFIKNIVNVEM